MTSVDKPKTFGYKLSELRPCDSCGQKLVPFFQHIQVRTAIFNTRNINSVFGTMQILGGTAKAFRIAEAMAAGADDAVEVMDKPTTLFICNECFLQPLDLAMVVEKMNNAKEKADASQGESAGVQGSSSGGSKESGS